MVNIDIWSYVVLNWLVVKWVNKFKIFAKCEFIVSLHSHLWSSNVIVLCVTYNKHSYWRSFQEEIREPEYLLQ